MKLDVCDRIFSNALACKSESEFCYEIERLWPFYKLLSVGLKRGSIFWRARLIKGDFYPSVAQLKYPSKEIADIGRLNDKGVPCFYAAKNMETSLIEIGATEGQFVQLAGFRLFLDSSLRLALIGEYANVQKTGYISFSGTDPDGTIRKMLNKMPMHEAIRSIYIDKFFSGILASVDAQNENYFKSRALGATIHLRISTDGIAFPSVRDYGGFNVAIKPESFDEKMHNVCCLVVKVGKLRKYGLLEYEIVRSVQQIDDAGKFYWSTEQNPKIVGIYGMTREEYEFAKKLPQRNDLTDLTTFYSQRG